MVERKFNPLIILGGVITSAICLVLVYFIGLAGLNLMGLYVLIILPGGALLVGIGSGTGYALASYLTNVKMTKNDLIIVGVIALLSYIGSQYASYLVALNQEGISTQELPFWDYYKFIVESMTLTIERSDPIELGVWSWAFQVLELAGFVSGAIIPSGLLSTRSYCSDCQVYMKKVKSYSLCSALTTANLKHKKNKEKLTILEQAITEASEKYNEFLPQLQGSLGTIQANLSTLPETPPKNYLAQIRFDFFKCTQCDVFEIKAYLVNRTVDSKWNTKQIATINRQTDFSSVA